jgi:hypothetical protein
VTLDVWPALPLRIIADFKDTNEGNITGALGHRDRIVGIDLDGFNRSRLKKCIALMKEPFPVLRFLRLLLAGSEEMTFVIPDAFLNGSAPLLQDIYLRGIQSPSLPRLLSSTSNLVRLVLRDMPMTGEGHISPDVMTTCLSVLTKLQFLAITFLEQTLSSYPTDQHPPSSAHIVLPSLDYLWLEGPHEYLEDLLGRVDAPLLKSGNLRFYDDGPTHNTSQVARFIHRTKMFKLLGEAKIEFYRECICVSFQSSIGPAKFSLVLECYGLPAQVVITERICAQWPPLLSRVELLKLGGSSSSFEERKWREVITPWLGLLRPFTAVQTLCLFGTAPLSHVAHILGELGGERSIEVLPALRTIDLSHCVAATRYYYSDRVETLRLLGPFLAAREERERPVLVDVDSKYYK